MHIEKSILAYIAYPLSAYALILFIIWFIKACNFNSEFIHNTVLYKLYKKNEKDILNYSLTITGIYYSSWWFITIAIYYLILCLMKLLVLKNSKSIIRNIGIILLLMNFVLIGIVVLSLRHDYHIIYKDYLIYAVALYDFYLIITAIINVFKYKNDKSEVMVASKYIRLVVSMISMLELEIAMIYEFGNDDKFKLIMVSITELAIFIINIVLSIRMIYKICSKSLCILVFFIKFKSVIILYRKVGNMNSLAVCISNDNKTVTPYETIDAVVNTGFKNVFIQWYDQDFEVSQEDQLKYIREKKLNVIFAHLGYKNLNNIWLGNEIGEEPVKKYLRNLDECKSNNIDMVVMHACIGWDAVEPNELGLERFRKVCNYAEKLGIKVAFENTKMKGYLEFLLKNIKNDNVGICFDSGHYHCHFKDDFDFSLFKDKIFCVHIHDNYGEVDDHLLPYDGTLDYDKVINGLKSANYKGYTTLEICYRMNYVDKMNLKDFYIKGYEIGEKLDKQLKEE